MLMVNWYGSCSFKPPNHTLFRVSCHYYDNVTHKLSLHLEIETLYSFVTKGEISTVTTEIIETTTEYEYDTTTGLHNNYVLSALYNLS